jgi:hypothetical protein
MDYRLFNDANSISLKSTVGEKRRAKRTEGKRIMKRMEQRMEEKKNNRTANNRGNPQRKRVYSAQGLGYDRGVRDRSPAESISLYLAGSRLTLGRGG